MLRAVLRDLRAHPGRIAMTFVAIVLGVAFVVATWVVSDTAARSIAGGDPRTDLSVRVAPATPDASLTDADLQALQEIPGVRRATGVLVGYTALVGDDGKLSDTYYATEGGTSWDGSERFTLLEGRAPASPTEIAVEEKAALDAELTVGSTARLLDEQGSSTVATIVGVFSYRGAAIFETTPAVAFDPATAGRRLGPGYAWIELLGADEDALASAAASVLGGDVEVVTGTALAEERDEAAARDADAVRNFLLAFAGVAVFAGMFVIANTFTMLVAQRTRHFALLRAVGARRGQVRRAVLAEAGVLGLVGATVGAAVGVGLGWLAMALLRSTGETVIFTVSPMAIVAGFVVGVGVTVISAYGSARRAALVPPVAALGVDAALPRRSLRLRTVLGVTLIVIGTTAVVATAGPNLTDMKRVVGMSGALLGWLGVLLLAPILASAVLQPLARLVSRHGSPRSRLAVRNAIRDPRRTAATASALMIGLALVTAFTVVGASFKHTVTETISGDVPAGVSVVRAAQPWSPLAPSTVESIGQLSDVEGVAAPVLTGGELSSADGRAVPITVTAVEATALGRVLTPRLDSGVASVAGGGVLLPAETAGQQGIAVGDRVTVAVEDGSVTGRVTGIYARSEVLRGAVVDKALLPIEDASYLPTIFVLGGNPAATRATLDAAFADRPDVIVLSRAQLIDEYASSADLALNIIYGLLGAAVIIAVFGVVNTMALSVLERTREIGVLRAVGGRRRLLRQTIRLESVIIASYGGLLGVGVGVLLGGVMHHVLFRAPIFSLTLPVGYVIGALAAMVVVGALAALWPARRAARIDVLQAIATV